PILPGATIGVLGGGQLGRMFALAARALGYRIHIYSPEYDAPAGQVADREVVGEYEDEECLTGFAKHVQVVTFEFENVSSRATAIAAAHTPVRPAGHVLHISQHRLREKTFLRDNGFPVTPFRHITSLAELEKAAAELGLPAVLKTAGFGYDGKGQVKLTRLDELPAAWKTIGEVEAVYEAFVRFEKEISVIAARTLNGEIATFPVFENSHANHILDVTFAPAAIGPQLAAEARELAAGILEKLDVRGLLTVEMFVTTDGRVLVNELAPRPHNSGHLTIDACVTSQFEQQLRAICGLPPGSADLRQPAAMANLLGDVWSGGEPDWRAALADPHVKLHLYGKAEARKGRKMGHLTATGSTVEEAVKRVTEARRRLTRV
ncbi:MAG TPA: 5-(carboxyamino)imidazole ribonucleotide synthase, partial [Verrucomicrobiae bacterium]|nr:5-(carboxyamino)imidazole ribonucleotide synthase [Verrucomicrobiae bacterium]